MVIEILEMRGDPGAVEGEGDPSRLAGADGETGRQGCGGSPVVKVAVDDILQLGVPPEPNLDIPVKGPVLLGGVPLLLEELDGVHGGKGGVGLRDGAVEDQAGGIRGGDGQGEGKDAVSVPAGNAVRAAW